MTDQPVVRDPSTEDQWLAIHRLADSIAEIALTIPSLADEKIGTITNTIQPYILERITAKRAKPILVTKKVRDEVGSGHHEEIGYGRIPVTKFVRRLVYMRDGWRCVSCRHEGSPDNPLTVDHIKPVVKGGVTALENLQTMCSDCNNRKNDTYEEGL